MDLCLPDNWKLVLAIALDGHSMSEWDDKARFFARTVHLSLFQTLRRWLRSGFRNWDRKIIEYDAVHPGDPRYERAPYSTHTVYVSNLYTVHVSKP
jgi:hypothetical protein